MRTKLLLGILVFAFIIVGAGFMLLQQQRNHERLVVRDNQTLIPSQCEDYRMGEGPTGAQREALPGYVGEPQGQALSGRAGLSREGDSLSVNPNDNLNQSTSGQRVDVPKNEALGLNDASQRSEDDMLAANSPAPSRATDHSESKTDTHGTQSEMNSASVKSQTADAPDDTTQAQAKPIALPENGNVKLPKPEQIAHRNLRKDAPVLVIVDKSKTQTYVLQEHEGDAYIVFEADNAIGTQESPSPPGPYKVASKTTQPEWIPPKSIDPEQKKIGPYNQNKDNPLGVAAVRLDKWNIVLHGTNNPSSIGKQVSHGCIRHRNKDIMTIYDSVKEGDTVLITDSLQGTNINRSMFKRDS